MNKKIEIHDNNTNETGSYKIFYSDKSVNLCRVLNENHTNALLTIRQKEDFFMGKYKFVVKSDYDFKTIVLNGEKRPGL